MAGSYIPGTSQQESLVNDIYKPLLGDGALTDNCQFGIKRLFWDAFVGHATELKRRANVEDGDERIKRMPNSEKVARFDEIKLKLVGLDLDNEEQAEPSYRLIDLIVDMVDRDENRHIKWEECTCRENEQRGLKKIPALMEDPATGHLKRINTEVAMPDAEYKTDAQLRFVFTRRGIAFEIGRYMSYMSHELIVKFLLKALREVPLYGFNYITIEQIHRADVEIFKQLAKLTRVSLQPDLDGKPIMDKFVPQVLKEERVKWLLMPSHMAGAVRSEKSPGFLPPQPQAVDRQVQNLKDQVANLKKAVTARKGNDFLGKGPGKGKGKGRGKRAEGSGYVTPLPAALRSIPGAAALVDGTSACFDFNLGPGKCKRLVLNNRCDKGVHKCMVAGCKKSMMHGASEHGSTD